MLKKLLGKFSKLPSGFVKFCESDLFIKIVFGWFVLQALYIAMSTTFGVPPDERYHYYFIQLFAHSGWLPVLSNQDGYYYLGEVIKLPFFLYHYLLSLPLHLFYNASSAIYILRFINILISSLVLVITIRICDLLRLPKIVKNISVFMLASTLMFVFISSSINYDNLFNLVSISSVYLLLLNLESVTLFRFLVLLSLLVSGMLIKINFLPIAFIIVIVLLVNYYRTIGRQVKSLVQTRRSPKKINIGLAVLFVILSGLFVQRYIFNEINYGSYAPGCVKVQTLQHCKENAIFVRNEALKSSAHRTANRNPLNYFVNWSKLMAIRTFGVFGHKRLNPTGLIMVWMTAVAVFGVVATLIGFNKQDQQINTALFITIFYTTSLILNNFGTYKRYGSISLAVQGRYLFAVLPLMYMLTNYYILKLLKTSYVKSLYLLITIVVFLISCLPIYIIRTDASWHEKITSSND